MPSSTSLLRLLPAVLLLGAIGIHGVRIVRDHEDPQAGTAFAMFGSVDGAATRRVLVEVPGRSGLRLIPPTSLDEAVLRLKESPSSGRARDLAADLAAMGWQVNGEEAEEGGTVHFDEVRVLVVGLEADGRTLTRRELASATAGGAR